MESQTKYDLVFKGEILDGFDVARVKAGLARIFKTDEARIGPMFSGSPVFIKKGIDYAATLKIKEVFEKAGAVLRREVSLEAAPPQNPSPAPQAADAPVQSARPPAPPPSPSAPDASDDPFDRYHAEKLQGLPTCPACNYQPRDRRDNLYVKHNGKGECPSCGIIVDNFLKKKQKEHLDRLAAGGENQTHKQTDPSSDSTGNVDVAAAPTAALPPDGDYDALLAEAKQLMEEKKWDDARTRLEMALAMYTPNWEIHYLLAKAYSDDSLPDDDLDELAGLDETSGGSTAKAEKEPPDFSEKVFFHAGKAFELGGDSHPGVLEILGQALGDKKEIQKGLSLLEKGAALEQEQDGKWASIVGDYRKKHNLGDLWQFFDRKGNPVFASTDMDQIRQRLIAGTIPASAGCVKNQVGKPRPMEETLAKQENKIKILFHPLLYHIEMGAMILGGITGGIGALMAGGWYVIEVFRSVFSEEYLSMLLSNIIGTIAAILLLGWLALGLFVIVLTLVAGVGGIGGALPGGVAGAFMGLLVGLIRLPFLPKLPASGTGK